MSNVTLSKSDNVYYITFFGVTTLITLLVNVHFAWHVSPNVTVKASLFGLQGYCSFLPSVCLSVSQGQEPEQRSPDFPHPGNLFLLIEGCRQRGCIQSHFQASRDKWSVATPWSSPGLPTGRVREETKSDSENPCVDWCYIILDMCFEHVTELLIGYLTQNYAFMC